MVIRVYCSLDNKEILRVNKASVSEQDIMLYKKSCACEEHGRNTYVYEQLSQERFDEQGQPYSPPQYDTWDGDIISSEEHIQVEILEEE